MTGKQLTMDENGVIIVEKPERFNFKLLKTSGRIVAVIQCCISGASIEGKLKRKLTYRTMQKKCKRNSPNFEIFANFGEKIASFRFRATFTVRSPVFPRSIIYTCI